ncbi:MAG TPA: hypothetical protein ENJ53_02455 [Phaeodactylibacter sp.]|nr:hypothetical protein [Phaeodactylibacter sp.]
MKLLSTIFILFFSIVLFGQSIQELEQQLKNATDNRQIMNLKYDLAELYKGKDHAAAARYAFESYDLARKLKDIDMQILASYLDAEIHLERRDYKKADARFKASLKHSKKAGDTEFALENLKQLEKLEVKKRDYKSAYNYAKQAAELLSKGVAPPSNRRPRPSAPPPTTSTPSSSQIDKNEVDKYVATIRKLKRAKTDLEEENNSLLTKIERLGSGNMDTKEFKKLQDELKAEAELRNEEKEQALLELGEKEAALERITQEKIRTDKNARKIKKEFDVLSDQAKSARLLQMDAEVKAEQSKNFMYLLGLVSLFVLFLASIFYNRFRVHKKAKLALEETNRQIEDEKKRSDDLLLNILPQDIAKELKEKGKAAARKYENVSVLFTDFKDFTHISEKLSPEQLVRELDYCFRGFDFIISQYGIEKIKTIGDAYMCASGLTNKRTMPVNIIKAALEMQEFMEDYKKEREQKGLPYFEARIGIHTGPVVAGVVGVKKFAYEIWGDTVNIAARMEANAKVGKVNISEETYRQVKYNFDCEYRGKIEAKNKGFVDMYFVKQPIAVGVA